MPDIILHHYPESPFSEKIRLLLGYKGVAYNSVIIPVMMPKPDLMPLTGGYRKTPVMQIGADIYCDSAIIARTIDDLYPQNSIYPRHCEAVAGALAHWTDTFLFKVAVAVAFQPRGLANNAILSDAETAAAFAADRAELTKGSSELRLALEIAEPFFIQHLARLNSQLGEGAGFLFGDAPTIADFSTYHCLWFVHNNEVLRQIFAPYPEVNQWMSRMAGLGQAEAHDMSGKEALAIAKDAVPIKRSTVIDVEGPGAGDDVEVMPIDYGFNPVAGKLRVSSFEEIVLARQDEQLGQVAVHFPRLGFEVRRARA